MVDDRVQVRRKGAHAFGAGLARLQLPQVVPREVEVRIDGQAQATQGPGDHFGEIALLQDIPRTATVIARNDVELFALARKSFLDAVTGHAGSAAAAEAVVSARLGASPG